jgi:hypothetical protein
MTNAIVGAFAAVMINVWFSVCALDGTGWLQPAKRVPGLLFDVAQWRSLAVWPRNVYKGFTRISTAKGR